MTPSSVRCQKEKKRRKEKKWAENGHASVLLLRWTLCTKTFEQLRASVCRRRQKGSCPSVNWQTKVCGMVLLATSEQRPQFLSVAQTRGVISHGKLTNKSNSGVNCCSNTCNPTKKNPRRIDKYSFKFGENLNEPLVVARVPCSSP